MEEAPEAGYTFFIPYFVLLDIDNTLTLSDLTKE